MQKGAVYNNDKLAGILEKRSSDDYRFTYTADYFNDSTLPAISLTLPKDKLEHQSSFLFSFFAGLLAEGVNKDIQCKLLHIDENDDFTRLLKTAGEDTIGAITIKELSE
ncbi:phosphatidylinositol kinase [Niastella yeongjuensis]|uniref:Phosphatidylinositol kinase n=1 Tax=Niastella yeongjuensis TaxID=354355 RepID=A0A1V9F7C9_9BACT|nr:HipA N-terminal domain-containing protein [Niastella yeongjuensis]OQP54319.1 phosphatidylinositol kinase [Niastella yeongjuensis]SEP30294.1 serine/threonine-protein kinase HipA [Niastella yeongjuensis]